MRNYTKEHQWSKTKYDTLKVCIEKEIGMKFREKLAREEETITQWFKKQMLKEISDNDPKNIPLKDFMPIIHENGYSATGKMINGRACLVILRNSVK